MGIGGIRCGGEKILAEMTGIGGHFRAEVKIQCNGNSMESRGVSLAKIPSHRARGTQPSAVTRKGLQWRDEDTNVATKLFIYSLSCPQNGQGREPSRIVRDQKDFASLPLAAGQNPIAEP